MSKKILPLLLIAFSLGLSACGSSSTSDNSNENSSGEVTSNSTSIEDSGYVAPDLTNLKEIKLDTTDVKKTYRVLQEPDFSGLKVTAVFNDNSEVSLLAIDYSVSHLDTSSKGSKTVTVSYGNKTATFEVEVVDDPILKDVKFIANVSGDEGWTYSGHTSTVWINTDVTGEWDVYKLTQDSDDDDIWTIEFEDVRVDEPYNRYSYNYYYGTDEGVEYWAIGKNRNAFD